MEMVLVETIVISTLVPYKIERAMEKEWSYTFLYMALLFMLVEF